MLSNCPRIALLACGFLAATRAFAATNGSESMSTTSTPTAPVSTASTRSGTPDASEHKRPFTITATLREEYDTNIDTATTGVKSSFKTDISPTILFDLPMDGSDFAARYTFGLDYYWDRSGGSFDLSHDVVAQFKHSFSERFDLSLAEQFRYSSEPSLLDSSTTLYRNGAYYSNTINTVFDAQWTPIFGTSTTFSNSILRYEDAAQSFEQDNMENIGSQNFSFAILPKINLAFGGIVDDISYDHISRGYTSYTGNTGIDWQALPNVSVGGRVGASLTDTVQSGSSVSPYGSLTAAWKIGARSSLSFNYVHSIVPSDEAAAEGQIADRFTTTLRYDINPKLTAHFGAAITHGEYTQSLITPGTLASYSENDVALETGLAYHYNSYLDFEAGYIFSNVSSDLSFRDYTRHQLYLGIRGTY